MHSEGRRPCFIIRDQSGLSFQVNKLEAVVGVVAASLDEGNGPKGDWTAQSGPQAVVAANQVQRHRQRYTTEGGFVAEQITEKDAVPEIDPAHGASFTTNGDHGACFVVEKATAVLRDQ